MFDRHRKYSILFCVGVVSFVVFAASVLAIDVDGVLAAWQTRSQPGPNMESPPECYTPPAGKTLPLVAASHGPCSINPSDTQYVLPGTYIHFDASGGGDCDVVGTGGCSPACTGTNVCATNRRNNWTHYSWTTSDPNVFALEFEWGWIDEFVWVRVDPEPVWTTGWVGVERDEVDNADDPAPSPVVRKCSIEVMPPAGFDAFIGVHYTTGITDLPWAKGKYDAVWSIYLNDTQSVWTPVDTATYEVTYYRENLADNPCGLVPRIPDTQTALAVYGEENDGLEAIDTAEEFWGAMSWPVDVQVVLSLRHNGLWLDPTLNGIALSCADPVYSGATPEIIIERDASSFVWGHEWAHTALCIDHVADTEANSSNIMLPSPVAGNTSASQCGGGNDPQIPPY